MNIFNKINIIIIKRRFRNSENKLKKSILKKEIAIYRRKKAENGNIFLALLGKPK